MAWSHSSIDDIVRAAEDHQRALAAASGGKLYKEPFYGARMILSYLATLPGEGWNDRWLLLDARTAHGGDWREIVRPGSPAKARQVLMAGLGVLLRLDVIRPTYAWQQGASIFTYRQLSEHRDPVNTTILRAELSNLGGPALTKMVYVTVGRLQAHTGKSVRQLTAQDLLTMDAAVAGLGVHSQYRRSLAHLWRVLTELGWITHDSTLWPVHPVRQPRLTPEQMVDRYRIGSPQREVFIEYLKHRSVSTDYSTLRAMARGLLKTFWLDIARRHPDLPSFALTRDIAEGWKARLRSRGEVGSGIGVLHDLFLVRAFYLDMAQWALEDSYWVQWATTCPISKDDVAGYAKQRRLVTARTQQRTRQIAPILPQLIAQAERDRRTSALLLEQAREIGDGGSVRVENLDWRVRHTDGPRAPIRIRRDDQSRNLSYEEDTAFWTWAVVETLRLTGIRCEELQELTHMAIVPYRLPATGEEIPLLHIAPSKTDEERLLVAAPELVHVLAEVIHRVRRGQQDVPLTQRWDKGEHQLSEPLPHLFCTWFGPELRPLTQAKLTTMLHRLADRAGIRVNGAPIAYTSHDFRRVFATDALASGLPPHIVQVLMGHKSIATTQIYAAVYPQDVIRHHRTWISQRRLQRPSEEYRQPTAAEWDEFESHVVKRKVSLGTCGRAYGTNCHHEHAPPVRAPSAGPQ